MITYEYPLNERIRTLLRLEDLFERSRHFIARTEPHDHHMALLTLFEIMEVAGRADLKSDLLQELERQKQVLLSFRNNPDIAEDALAHVLRDIEQASQALFSMTGKIGQYLRENDWLMSIKQRTGIPGGACEFDLPSYHYWLHRPRKSAPASSRPGPGRSIRCATAPRSSCGSCASRASRRRWRRRRACSSRCSAARPRRCCACASTRPRRACPRSAPTSTCSTSASWRRTAHDPRPRTADWDVGLRAHVLQSCEDRARFRARAAARRREYSPRTSGGPFCSERCRLIDLGKWAADEYRLPEKET